MARRAAAWMVVNILALAGTAEQSAADPLPPNSGDRAALAHFKQLDQDGSLALPPDALTSRRAARHVFAILDRDGDSRLTAADGAPARTLLSRMHTPSLSGGQFAQLAASRWIAALDIDGDGRLTLAELRPSLAGNAPLDESRRPTPRPDLIPAPSRPQSCWLYDGTRWVELPASASTCRSR